MAGLVYAGRHLAADMISTLLFAVVYATTGHLALAIASGFLVGLGQLVWEVKAGRAVNAMQAISLLLVVAFGAASLIADDPRIAMLKPTVVYAAIGAAMLKPGWINRYMTERALQLSGDIAFVFGFVWAGLMLGTAILNLVVAWTMTPAAWATFVMVFPLGSKVALFAIHYLVQRSVARARRDRLAPLQPRAEV